MYQELRHFGGLVRPPGVIIMMRNQGEATTILLKKTDTMDGRLQLQGGLVVRVEMIIVLVVAIDYTFNRRINKASLMKKKKMKDITKSNRIRCMKGIEI